MQKDSYFRLSTAKKGMSDVMKKMEDVELWLKTSHRMAPEPTDVQSSPMVSDDELEMMPTFHIVKKEEFVFKMAKVNFNEVRMTNFLLSCLKTISRSEQYLNPAFLNSYTMNDERF